MLYKIVQVKPAVQVKIDAPSAQSSSTPSTKVGEMSDMSNESDATSSTGVLSNAIKQDAVGSACASFECESIEHLNETFVENVKRLVTKIVIESSGLSPQTDASLDMYIDKSETDLKDDKNVKLGYSLVFDTKEKTVTLVKKSVQVEQGYFFFNSYHNTITVEGCWRLVAIERPDLTDQTKEKESSDIHKACDSYRSFGSTGISCEHVGKSTRTSLLGNLRGTGIRQADPKKQRSRDIESALETVEQLADKYNITDDNLHVVEDDLESQVVWREKFPKANMYDAFRRVGFEAMSPSRMQTRSKVSYGHYTSDDYVEILPRIIVVKMTQYNVQAVMQYELIHSTENTYFIVY
ncbi:hypothetical protein YASMINEVIRUS_675 [Yasminevirus sp. GU-2018]|uniref:Uncharacterized protein n=1 Tax=Yasminevirus sp. GU-2018 TaxID=2420051 RepID=A0A5K0U9R5_9VIRU|nr:hypothetical protein YASMINEVIRUS_675 [Yasminevirus sp. GU-2018]